jgi:hypothetical protein
VKDATADYSDEFMRAALVTNLPNYANAIVPTGEVLEAISVLVPSGEKGVPNVARESLLNSPAS